MTQPERRKLREEKEISKQKELELKIEQGLLKKVLTKTGKIAYIPILTEEQKIERSNNYKNRFVSEETKQKTKESLKEYYKNNTKNKLTDEQKNHLKEIHTGKKLSIETKDKISNSAKGSNNPSSKLTEEDILEIRNLVQTNQLTRKEISEKFKINYSTVNKIVQRKLWSHI